MVPPTPLASLSSLADRFATIINHRRGHVLTPGNHCYTNSWLVVVWFLLSRCRSRCRFITCFPHVGHSTLTFRFWAISSQCFAQYCLLVSDFRARFCSIRSSGVMAITRGQKIVTCPPPSVRSHGFSMMLPLRGNFGRRFVPQRPPEFVGRFLIPIFLSDHRPSAVLSYCARENAAHFLFFGRF